MLGEWGTAARPAGGRHSQHGGGVAWAVGSSSGGARGAATTLQQRGHVFHSAVWCGDLCCMRRGCHASSLVAVQHDGIVQLVYVLLPSGLRSAPAARHLTHRPPFGFWLEKGL